MAYRRFLAVMVMLAGFFTLAVVFLPGSQPGEGRPLEAPGNCGCHRGYDTVVEPMYNWRGSMMAMSARDPIFFAALDLANHDLAAAGGAGSFCLRCHSPSAHQGGRTTTDPTGSNFTALDKEGVSCDVCHALVDPLSTEGRSLVEPDVTSYGNAMFVFTLGQEKRGPYNDAQARHVWQYSSLHRESEVCASCHDVSNPLLCDPADPYNVQKCFTEQRTYSEWKNSYYATLGEPGNCQACHMPHVANGTACKQGPTRTFLPVHHQSGGNYWVPDALQFLYPGDNTIDFAALAAGKQRALNLLQNSATLAASDQTNLAPGRINVRITNTTGHKLPTGYPEGRRMWINVVGYNASEQIVFQSGAYNLATATLLPDGQEKIYEAHFGVLQADGSCQVSFRLAQNNCLEKDNRIPPRGFTNAAFNAVGAGHMHYHYADGQYWDDTPYTLPTTVYRVVVNLYYQTTTREYIEFLATAPGSGTRGATVLNAFNSTNKAAPVTMETFALVFDNDKDGMGNTFELAYGLNPNSAADAATDLDGDGLTNLEEYLFELPPNDADADDDGLLDGPEIETWFTDPLLADTDGDGLEDGGEVGLGTDPLDVDTDAGGESDGSEYLLGRNLLDPADDGEVAVYDPSWTAPHCTSGRGVCLVYDDLIGGRDHIVNGNEPNQPNTIAPSACADGTKGEFMQDESIDELYVTDLSNFEFTAGDTVEVTVKVWCWTDVGFDQVHVFNGNSADGFVYLGSDSCDAVGRDTLKVTGRLANRAGDQAIRAVFSFQSTPALCDGGSYADHDDVVLTVAAPITTVDTDGDGLNDGQEISIGTDLNDPDTDDDGLLDGEEFFAGLDPRYWDSDLDALPDLWEQSNMSGHTQNFDPLVSADGAADFDGDGIANRHEYWNGTSHWVSDLVGFLACGYWGEGDGDGFISPSDLSVISLAIKGNPGYATVYPPNGETQDLDSDTFLSPGDKGMLSGMIKSQALVVLGSRPVTLERVSPPTGVALSAHIGDTVSVTLAVKNTAGSFTPGIPVLFSQALGSTAGGTFLGGEGQDWANSRYDLSGTVAGGGQSRVVVRVEDEGTLLIQAEVRQCGADGLGRYCASINLAEPVQVNVTP